MTNFDVIGAVGLTMSAAIFSRGAERFGGA